jgi:hypothetical protein
MAESAAGGAKPAKKPRMSPVNWVVLATGVGALLCFCGPLSGLAMVVVPLGAAYSTAYFFADKPVMRRASPPIRWGLTVLVVIGAGLLPLVLGGFLTRHFESGDYYRAVGTHVTATVDTSKCDWINKGRRGNSDTMGCQGVTWTIGGHQQTGSMEIKGEDNPSTGSSGTVQVAGYALGNAAASDRTLSVASYGAYMGAVPLWLGLVSIAFLGIGYGTRTQLEKRQR